MLLMTPKLIAGAVTTLVGVAAPVAASSSGSVSTGTALTAVGLIFAGLGFVIKTVWSAASERSNILAKQDEHTRLTLELKGLIDTGVKSSEEYRQKLDTRIDALENRVVRIEAACAVRHQSRIPCQDIPETEEWGSMNHA